MDKKTFLSERECKTYNCHSDARRVQLSIKDVETRELAGKFANKNIMQRASSMSRTASINVGYLHLIIDQRNVDSQNFTHLSLTM
jgi:hypothetical protein